MIAIFSKSRLEGATDEVIDWLKYYGALYIRINGSDFISSVIMKNFDQSSFTSQLEKCNSFWFRRWMDDGFLDKQLDSVEIFGVNRTLLENHLMRELNLLSNELWRKLKNKHWITKPTELISKKLEMIDRARNVGLLIPETLVSTDKSELIAFKNKFERIITKTIGDVPGFSFGGINYSLRTAEVDDEIIYSLPTTFFPSLFQRLIDKEFEVRIFFLYTKFYSMAIFSQLDKQTEIDFRNYNRSKPNRTVPFKLPSEVQDKLKKLINELNLTSGSIDMIKRKDSNEYYFLEINPVGQIGMTSYPCNYYLERSIAKKLIENDK